MVPWRVLAYMALMLLVAILWNIMAARDTLLRLEEYAQNATRQARKITQDEAQAAIQGKRNVLRNLQLRKEQRRVQPHVQREATQMPGE